jgi:hypothetical protein
MKAAKKIILSVLVLAIGFLVQNAGAALTSSYYDGSVIFDKIWDDGYLYGRIDFAVYDDRSEYESVTGLDAPGEGTYVYAYQIFNDLVFSDKAVTYFSLIGLDESIVSGMGTQDDGSGGKTPAEWSFNTTEGYWKWTLEGTNSFIYKDDHSWLLVFSSNQDYVKGSYDIRGPEGENEVPQPKVPEPASILVLLGAAGLMLRRKKQYSPSNLRA